MSKTYTVTLSEAEDKALGWCAVSQQEWIDNAIHHRCLIAIEDIVQAEIQRKLAASETISGTKEEIVLAAPIKSLAQREAERIASHPQ
jgi:hypothetical protein